MKVKKFKNISSNFKNINVYIKQYYKLYHKNITRDPDQIFLRKVIYPIIKNDNMSHISDPILRYSKNDILIPKNK